MAEIFRCDNLSKLLENKYVVILGDSVQRCIYKDLICAVQQDNYLTDKDLRNKGERTHYKDELLEGGRLGGLTNGTGYREVRQYHTDYHLVRFYFVTRCYNKYVQKVLTEIKDFSVKPDVFIMNSCLWDISRYGANGVEEYKKNLLKLTDKLKTFLPESCVVLWNSTLPISSTAKGGFIIPEVEALTSTLRLDIIHANNYARKIIMDASFDVLDLHFFLRNHLHRRAGDGVHWDMTAHRRITNLIMTQISEAWGIDFPKNTKPAMIDSSILNLLFEGHDDDSPHKKVVSDAIKARPKAKAKRRNRQNQHKFEIGTNYSGFNQSPNILVDNRYIQGLRPMPVRRPTTNLPMMVDPMERYGGPITPNFSPMVYNSPAISPWPNGSGMLFNGLNTPVNGLVNGNGLMSRNTVINPRTLFPGEQCSFRGRQTGGHSNDFRAHVNSVTNQVLGMTGNGFTATMTNKNSPMSIYSLNSQHSKLLPLDGQRYPPGFSPF